MADWLHKLWGLPDVWPPPPLQSLTGIKTLDLKSSEWMSIFYLNSSWHLKHAFCKVSQYPLLLDVLGNFYCYPFELIGEPFQYNVYVGVRVMVEAGSDGTEGGWGCRSSGGGLVYEASRGFP